MTDQNNTQEDTEMSNQQVFQYLLRVTELIPGEELTEVTHEIWLSNPRFLDTKSLIASLAPDLSNPRPHPRYHQCKFFLPAQTIDGVNWTEETFNPASPAFEVLLDTTLPELAEWEDMELNHIHYGYLFA